MLCVLHAQPALGALHVEAKLEGSALGMQTVLGSNPNFAHKPYDFRNITDLLSAFVSL